MALTQQDLKSIEQIVDKRILRTEALIEDVDDKLIIILEGIASVHEQLAPLKPVPEGIRELKSDVKVIKQVVREHSALLEEHDKFIKAI